MSAFDFDAQDLQLIAGLLAGQVRVVYQPDGSMGYTEGTGSYTDVIDGLTFLSQFHNHPAAQADSSGVEKWQHIAQVAASRIDQMYEQRMAADPTFATEAFLKYEQWHREGHPAAGQQLVEHVQRYGAPSPVARALVALPVEEREAAAERLQKTAEARGLTLEQHISALNEAAQKSASPELVPTHQGEAQAADALRAIGRQRIPGRTAEQSLGAYLREQAEGKLEGARRLPFDPRLSQEQKDQKFLETVPKETVNQFLKAGIDPRQYLARTLDNVRTATVHDEVQGRMARRDAKLPPMPKPVFNESNDRRADLHRAFAAHAVTPEQMVPQRRHQVANDRELAVRAAYSEHAGETPEQFQRSTYVPPSVAEEYEDVEVPGRESEDDSPRADLQRAFQQHGG